MIAIDMKMPERCEDCRFEREDGSCCAMSKDFMGSTWDSPAKGKPGWCPLRQVDKFMVENIVSKEDIEYIGRDTVKKYLKQVIGAKFGDAIVNNSMYELEEIPDNYMSCPAIRVRASVCVVKSNDTGGVLD